MVKTQFLYSKETVCYPHCQKTIYSCLLPVVEKEVADNANVRLLLVAEKFSIPKKVTLHVNK